MTCRESLRSLPGYLDGATRAGSHSRLREHLDSCFDCREQLERYRRLAACLAQVGPIQPPSDLATRIRVEAARSRSPWMFARNFWDRAVLVFQNILEPLAVPATGGILTAAVIFVLIAQNILVGMPLGAVPNDLPLNLVQPARLESLAPFSVPGVMATGGHATSGALLLEVTVNAQGEVSGYKILSGPNDVTVQHQLDQVLLFSRFRPELNFGRPTSGGHVFLSFSEVRVRG